MRKAVLLCSVLEQNLMAFYRVEFSVLDEAGL